MDASPIPMISRSYHPAEVADDLLPRPGGIRIPLALKGPAVREISRRVTSCDPDHVAIETWMSECVYINHGTEWASKLKTDPFCERFNCQPQRCNGPCGCLTLGIAGQWSPLFWSLFEQGLPGSNGWTVPTCPNVAK